MNSVTKRNVAHLRKFLSNGHSDEQAPNVLRDCMCTNVRGMRSDIRAEKISSARLTLSTLFKC